VHLTGRGVPLQNFLGGTLSFRFQGDPKDMSKMRKLIYYCPGASATYKKRKIRCGVVDVTT